MEEEFLTKDKLEFLEIRNPKIQNQPAGRQVCYSKFKIIVCASGNLQRSAWAFQIFFIVLDFRRINKNTLLYEMNGGT